MATTFLRALPRLWLRYFEQAKRGGPAFHRLAYCPWDPIFLPYKQHPSPLLPTTDPQYSLSVGDAHYESRCDWLPSSAPTPRGSNRTAARVGSSDGEVEVGTTYSSRDYFLAIAPRGF